MPRGRTRPASCRRPAHTVADTIPSEGATGWADSWLLAAKAPHPNCAYKWMAYISTPKVQAEQAVSYGETPGQLAGLPAHGQDLPRARAPRCTPTSRTPTSRPIKFWKTPLAQCDNGKTDCVPFQQWVTAWTQITG